MQTRSLHVVAACALLTTLAVGGGCGLLSKITRMPSGAGREMPPEKIEDRALAVGAKAPPFELPTHTGATFSLKDANATAPVVVVFFRGEWCPLCARQMIELAENAAALDATGATFVALNPDRKELSSSFAEETNWPYPILIDADRATIKAYGLYDAENDTAWPTIYIIDRDGVIRYRGLSETKDVRPTSKHVLAALRALPTKPKGANPVDVDTTPPSETASVTPSAEAATEATTKPTTTQSDGE